jgi:uncharacterized protein with HEPN domain
MSRHDDSLSLRQMRDHIEEAMVLANSRTRGDLDADRLFALALLKLVEIVGEAALRISESTQLAHPEIPWREITGTRHHLVHGYDAVDYDILWNIVTFDFPPLASRIKALLPEA